MALLIDASNIGPGGTLVLLSVLCRGLEQAGAEYKVVMRSALTDGFNVERVQPYDGFPFGRRKLLRRLVRTEGFRRVLHFGNLATWRRIGGAEHTVYFQNLNILFPRGGGSNSLKQVAKNHLMRRLMKLADRHVSRYFVQTGYCAKMVANHLDVARSKVVVRPFFESQTPRRAADPKRYRFIYPASYYPHKNHARLCAAFGLLASKYHLKPSLLLLSEPTFELREMVRCANGEGANITLLGPESHRACLVYMRQSETLVFPSLLESLGLPLVEAAGMGLSIIASDRPYVHAAVRPSATFDPENVDSLTNALRLACGESYGRCEIRCPNELSAFVQEISGPV